MSNSTKSTERLARAHTPTPWAAPPRRVHPSLKVETERHITGPNEMILAKLMHAHQDANAAFVVRAVNSHDALVEALEDILSDREGEIVEWQVLQARAALTLAKGA